MAGTIKRELEIDNSSKFNVNDGVKHWWEEPLRILDLLCIDQLDSIDYADTIKFITRMHANTVHFHVEDCLDGGIDEDGFYFRCRHARKENRDILAEFLPLAHDAGIRVVVYTDNHWFPKTFGDKHPDWWVIKVDGSRVENLYGNDDTTFCINSPWRDWSYAVFNDLCAYNIDGIFMDGPLTFLGRGGCYCESCQEKFLNNYGRKMPVWSRDDLDTWKILVEFTAESLQDYYRDAYKAIKSIKPEVAVSLNSGNEREPQWLCGRRNRLLVPYQDMLLAEGGFHYGRLLSNKFHTPIGSKLYSMQAGGKPAANAVSSAFGAWRIYTHSAPEMRITLNEASIGVNPYFAVFAKAMNSPSIDAAAEVYSFLEENESCYRKTKSEANVGLVYSQQTLDFYRGGADVPVLDISGIEEKISDEITTFSRSFEGYYEMLFRARIPFDLVDEHILESEGLHKYKLIILPNCACLSSKQCRALKEYVAEGGCIISEFETSHYDEWGARLDSLGLAEVLGVTSTGKVFGPRRWDFAFALDNTSPYLQSLDQPEIPAPQYDLGVNSDTACVPVVLGEALISNLPKAYTPSDRPFLAVNSYGRGKSFYFSGLMGDMYAKNTFTPYKRILESIIHTEATVPVEISGVPHLLNVTLRSQPDGLLMLHLVNYEISSVDEVIPAENIKINYRGKVCPRSVKALKLGCNLDFAHNTYGTTFVLPVCREYELIVIE